MKKALGTAALLLALASCSGKNNTAPDDGATVPAAMTATASASEESADALVPGTDYNATAKIMCGFKAHKPEATCPAGVKRQWSEDGTTLVEVTKPDGMKRALFFRGTTPYGADSAQADGSAGWDFRVSRQDDNSVIVFGPETYLVPDALVEGG